MTNSSNAFLLLEGLEASISRGLLPRWFLWAYLTVVILGGLLTNGLLAGYLLKRRTFPAVFHLCLADMTSLLLVAPYEILLLTDSLGIWNFPTVCCPIFLGLEVLLGTVTIYLIIVINFSSATGSYKKSLKMPLLTVWLLAVSLSVPDFVFAEVISPRPNYDICCLPRRAAFLIGAFRLALPVFLLLLGTIIVIFVLFKTDNDDALRLALLLSLTYIAVSVQRSVFGVLYGILFPLSGPDAFRTPPIADVTQNAVGTLSLAMIHYTLSAVRPLIIWSATPEIRLDAELDDGVI